MFLPLINIQSPTFVLFKRHYTVQVLYNASLNSDITNDDTTSMTALRKFGVDMTAEAQKGCYEENFGREKELLELMEILARRYKNNPILIGEAGVGKTAIIETFAIKMVNNLVPFILAGRTIINIELTKIIAGAKFKGDFEARFQQILSEVLQHPNVIIFIDEIHSLASLSGGEGSLDAANILKPALSRGMFQCIGATTLKEYEVFAKNTALNRRFQSIKIVEPSITETIEILYGVRANLEAFHNAIYSAGALKLTAELTKRYIPERFLPDKAIDLLDRAGARAAIKATNATEGSIVTALVNSTLAKIGALKLEAFRKGNIGIEFLFTEIESAYKNFLLKWIEQPATLTDKTQLKTLQSPIAHQLYKHMRLSVLKRVDELLFETSQPKIKLTESINNFSTQLNTSILAEFHNCKSLTSTNISLYRISLKLLNNWLVASTKVTQVINPRISVNSLAVLSNYIQNVFTIVKKSQGKFKKQLNFCKTDVANISIVSKPLPQTQLAILHDFLKQNKPLLRKSVVKSLLESSEMMISEKELAQIYTLLGHASKNNPLDVFLPLPIQQSMLSSVTSKSYITQDDIKEILANMTGIPMASLNTEDSLKLKNLEARLHERVVGQTEAISTLAKAIKRSRLGIKNSNRPIGSFLFCGPTGVGKTEITKALAFTLFGTEESMIRFDMSEFMEKFAVSRLIGSPPGYVGYEQGGQLTDAVRKKPYSVVLFDELEKADVEILNVLLQILEDGRLTDSQQRLTSFENTVIIMTSNAAAQEIQQIITKSPYLNAITDQTKIHESQPLTLTDPYTGTLTFLKSPIKESFFTDLQNEIKNELKLSLLQLRKKFATKKYYKTNDQIVTDKILEQEALDDLKKQVMEHLKEAFLPEFLNRLDDIIIFKPLKKEELRRICDIMINKFSEQLKIQGITLLVDDLVKHKLTNQGYSPEFGARPLRRVITKYIEDLVSEKLLEFHENTTSISHLHIYLDDAEQISIKHV